MKRALIFSLLFFIVMAAATQPKTRGRVKRKYRNVEQVSENLPQVVFRGLVRDIYKNPLPGASVEILGIKRLVHSNEFGQFILTDLPTGRLRLKISHLGYRTKTIDYALQQGYNDHYIALDQEMVHLEPVISTAQKREQHVPDVPASISVVTKSYGDKLNVTGPEGIAQFNPALRYDELGAGKAGFYLHGSGGAAGFTQASPSVASFFDGVPLINAASASAVFFDIDRTEVLTGPHNTLFGRNAVGGVVHLISKKPDYRFNGYITAGGGNFGTKEARAAVNMPIVNKLLLVRAAGIFSATDGFVKNNMGGTLNGAGNYGGRLSLRFVPTYNHKLDITLNYNRKEHSGTAFMNPWYPVKLEDLESFEYQASLTSEYQPGSKQDFMNGTLTYRYFLNEHNYLTFRSSFQKSKATDVWDADGTALPALQMEDEQNDELLYHELRYNISRKSRLNGSAGFSYSREKNNRWHSISSRDQLISEILGSPGNFTMPAENRFPVHPQPLNPAPMNDLLLSGQHQEENVHVRLTQSVQAYLHFTYRLNEVLFFTGGVRGFYDRMKLNFNSQYAGGAESGLGQFSGSAPNLLYLPEDGQQMSNNSISVAGEAVITYRWNENFNLFVKGVRGRKPQVLLFAWDSRPQVVKAETINGAEAGWKWIIKQRVFWDVTGFFRRHSNVHTVQWGGAAGNGILGANGKATSYGAQSKIKASLVKGIEVFGNYAWMHSAFDSTGIDGSAYLYADNNFARAPQHSFSAGFSLKAGIVRGMHFFMTPWYSAQSQFYFTDANSAGLMQNGYGLLNIIGGIELDAPKVVLSVYGKNLLEEKYISSAGHWGGLIGMPTVVPGAPRMVGAKMTWSF